MAVTAIWSVKGRVDKVINYARNPSKVSQSMREEIAMMHAVEGTIEYAAEDIKTEERKYVTALNCMGEERAVESFKNTKKRYGKNGGIVVFHGYQSFKENEVTAEQAHNIGIELAKRLWGDRFEVVIATHLNTGHFHNHFVINSVSFKDGYKYYANREPYRRMREESDVLCREYGLSVIEETSGKAKSYAEWAAEKSGELTQRDTIRKDIDIAIKASVTQQQFISVMEAMGYEFKLWTLNGERLKYPSIKPPGAKGYFRFHKLGEKYDLPQIVQSIRNNRIREEPFPELYKTKSYTMGRLNGKLKTIKPRGLYALYLRYCYELGIIKNNPASVKRVSFLLREDVVRMDKYMEQSRVLGKYKIETLEQLLTTKQNFMENIFALTDTRRCLRNNLQNSMRAGDVNQIEFLKNEIAGISGRLSLLRKEVKILEQIEQRSIQVKENLQVLDKQKITDRKEVKENEYKFRSSRTAR